MRIAIVGAGIAGVTLAHELAGAGHEVVVVERRASVAAEGSFAQAGLLAAALAWPWNAALADASAAALALPPLPGWPAPANPVQWPWLWRGWRLARGTTGTARSAALRALAQLSSARQQALVATLNLAYDQSRGALLLVRQARAARRVQQLLAARPGQAGETRWLDADAARALEPALDPGAALAGAVHLPAAEAGNCRQFAHGLKAQAQRLGARFLFGQQVLRIRPGHPLRLDLAAGEPLLVDAAVLCTGTDTRSLLAPLGLRLPMRALHSSSITAPLRAPDGAEAGGPRASLVDLQQRAVLVRLGDRVRVAGDFDWGVPRAAAAPEAMHRLHRVLDHWFPGAATSRLAQHWRGSSPTLPDGLPAVGPIGADGLWLNVGHGLHGWLLACGAAAMLRAQIERQTVPLPAEAFAPQRWR
jgi:D-amino-acid dehydrogenase